MAPSLRSSILLPLPGVAQNYPLSRLGPDSDSQKRGVCVFVFLALMAVFFLFFLEHFATQILLFETSY